jgi:long-subunit fatty acid transport protein
MFSNEGSMNRSRLIAVFLVVLAAGKASASTEINGLFDARSGAMGGTGVAFLDSAGAIPTNPALLDQIGKLTLTLDGFLITSQPEAPYTVLRLDSNGQRYKAYDTVRSELTSAVLPFFGAAFRIQERVVVGAAVYPVIGQGTQAKYHPAPDENPGLTLSNEASMGLVEFGVPISVKLLDNLSIGAMWRVNYMLQTVKTPIAGNTASTALQDIMGNPVYADIDVSGLNFTGFQIGVFYKPLRNLGLGFTFRNKVVVDGEGTTTTNNPLGGAPLKLDTRQGFTNPHAFRAGVAWSVLHEQLLFALDFKYLMYSEAYKELTTVTVRNGKEMVAKTPAYWKDAFNVQFGTEYKLGQTWAVRAGYIMATSATPKNYAQQFMAPPGVSHLVSGGLGVKLHESFNVDLAAAYVVLQSTIDTPTQYNGGIGRYSAHTGEFSVSATYRK